MADFHPLQFHIVDQCHNDASLNVFRGTSFTKALLLEYGTPAYPGVPFGEYMHNSRNVEQIVRIAKEEHQIQYEPLILEQEYDQALLEITIASLDLSKLSKIVLQKYFPTASADFDTRMLDISLTPEETSLLTKDSYDYKIVLERLDGKFDFRRLVAFGKLHMLTHYVA